MQEEIERAHAQMTAPHSPPLPQPQPKKAKRNSHPQLNDDQRKLVEGFIRNYDRKPTAQWLARSAGISECTQKVFFEDTRRMALSLLRRVTEVESPKLEWLIWSI